MADFKIDPDYKEVAERLDDLFAKHPDASMRGSYDLLVADGKFYIAYTAECFRTADDPAPGIGTAWEQVPGATPYTKGSEMQNAETSAWGRAIVAVGASRSKRIASADEMRSAQARESVPQAEPPGPAPLEQVERVKADVLELGIEGWVKEQGFGWPWSTEEADYIDAKIASERKQLADAAKPATMSRAESKGKDWSGDLDSRLCPECGQVGDHAEGCANLPF